MKKLTPVLYVEKIEPCLPFWTALGFGATVQVPEGDRLGFVILVKDGVEVMLQTRDNVRHDLPPLAERSFDSATMLYVEVDDLDEVVRRLGDAPVVVPRRRSSYGADEIFVREPAGSVVGFAARSP